MINVLDLRVQAPPTPNGQPQPEGSSDDAFAALFDDNASDDVLAEDGTAEVQIPSGAAPVPMPAPVAANLSEGASGQNTTPVEGDDLAGLGPQNQAAHAITGVDPFAEEFPTAAEIIGGKKTARDGSNMAELVRSAEMTPPPARPPQVDQTGLIGDLNSVNEALDQPRLQGKGPDTTASAALMLKGDATPVTVTSVAVVSPPLSPAATGMVAPNRAGNSAPDEAKPNPDSDSNQTDATRMAKPSSAAVVLLPDNDVVLPQTGFDGTDGQFDALLPLGGESADLGLLGSYGLASNTLAMGLVSATAPQAGTAVAAAVAAAVPPASAGADRVEVILSPEELGRVLMEFRADGDGMRVFLTAERPETLELLRRYADQLAAELRQAGYSGASLSFGQWGQPHGEPQHARQSSPFPQAESRISAPQQAFPAKNMSGQGLDLRI